MRISGAHKRYKPLYGAYELLVYSTKYFSMLIYVTQEIISLCFAWEAERERKKAVREEKQLKKKHAVSSGRKTRSKRTAFNRQELMMSLHLYICY